MTSDDQQTQQPEAQPAPMLTVFPFPFGSIFDDDRDAASAAEPEQE